MNCLKKLLFFFSFQFFCGQVMTQENWVDIPVNHFKVDVDKKLILINKNLSELNQDFPEPKDTITAGGQSYFFEGPVLELEKGITYSVKNEQDEVYSLFFTELPIVTIDTENTIVDEPRVHAQFKLIESDGQFLEHDIGIEYRGGSTQSLPKKSLRIEFWNDVNGDEKENLTVLGMRSDDDWNLQAMYNEPLRLRSKLNFELWGEIDTLYYQEEEPDARNMVRQEYVELFINESYVGLYAISERMDRKQLKLKKPENGETRGALYKGVAWGGSTFTSLPSYNNNNILWGGFKHEYPSDNIDWADLYSFVEFVVAGNSLVFCENYLERLDVDNVVNYFIFMNLLRALDNTGKNIFIAKLKEEAPYFYVPWDLDATLGMFWNGNTDDWAEGILSNGLFDKLLCDESENGFADKLEKRWTQLRTEIITVDHLMISYENQFHFLESNGVYGRESMAWEGYSYEGEAALDYLRQWVDRRIIYLDSFFYNTELLTNRLPAESIIEKGFQIYPNPATDQLNIANLDNRCPVGEVIIHDAVGNFIRKISIIDPQETIDISYLSSGFYFLQIESCDGEKAIKRLMVK